MSYLLKRNGHYYYNRRIPDIYRDLDRRNNIRVSLRTDSRKQALRNAIIFNEEIEAYWQSLVQHNQPHDNNRFKKTVRIARQLGFSYKPLTTVASLPLAEMVNRIFATKEATPIQVEALLGGKDEPVLPLSKVLDKFWDLSKDKVMGKTAQQLRKWRVPRIRVMKQFIKLVGNKDLKDITKEDILAYRDWWLDRIQSDDKNPESANKDLVLLKGILETVADHTKPGLDIPHLFKKIKLKTRFKQKRLPFTTEQIRSLLQNPKLQNMNTEMYWFLFAASETGARPSELAGLLPQDIRLNDPVPHIAITDRKDRTLKNHHSERTIPLVGYALDAFKARPNGFPRYRDKPDNLTGAANKFLKENELLPSEQHSLYSFRHGFQDRILKVNAPDRVQAALMGHKFNRPMYGDGASLEQKKEWMDKVCVKPVA
ncbi:MAG TPA: DUF6538 domain-containing protein [Flavipsychrobacter sp.]|nr:DUF6538 domain-containing protein [Flavipsychrobacter sp.]